MSALVKAWALIFMCFFNGFTSQKMLCGPGHRAVPISGDASNDCDDCPIGTYMDKAEHTDVTCKPCSKIVNNNTEIVERNCTRFLDALIRCKPGHFRVNKTQIPEVDSCENCTQCELGQHQARPCQDYDDRLCCHGNQVASLDPTTNKFKCYDNFCGQNQYFERYSESCRTCPPSTFQLPKRHRDSDCVPLHLLNISSLGENCSSSDEVYSSKGVKEDNTLEITTTLVSKDNYSTDASIHGSNNSIQETQIKEFHNDRFQVVWILLLILLFSVLIFACFVLYSNKSFMAQIPIKTTKVCEFLLRQAPRLYAINGITMTVLIITLPFLLYFSLIEWAICVIVLMILLQIIFFLWTVLVVQSQKVGLRDPSEERNSPRNHSEYLDITGLRLHSLLE